MNLLAPAFKSSGEVPGTPATSRFVMNARKKREWGVKEVVA